MSSEGSLKVEEAGQTGSESERDLQSAGCEDGERRPQAKGCGQPQEDGKGKKEPPEGKWSWDTFILAERKQFRILPLRAVR